MYILLIKQIRYLLESIPVYLIYYICWMLPIDVASAFAGWLVKSIGKRLAVNKVAMRNLSMCFPHLSQTDKDLIIENMWVNLGRIFGEMPHWTKISTKKFNKRVQIIDSAKECLSTGGFLISGHFGNWELSSKIAKEKMLDLCLVHRSANNPYVNSLINRSRVANGVKLFSKGMAGSRKILNALKKNSLVGMLIDQKVSDGIDVPFFGVNAKTLSMPANVALKYNVPVIMASIKRTKGAYYVVEFHRPLVFSAKDDSYSVMQTINKELERWIVENPEQWFWVHRRW